MSVILTIEKGIPVPPVTTRQGHNIALLRAMQPGDSVYFDAPIAKHATRFYRVAKKLGMNIMIRKDGINGMRLWMLENAPAPQHRVVNAKTALTKIAKRANNVPIPLGNKHDGARNFAVARNKELMATKRRNKQLKEHS